MNARSNLRYFGFALLALAGIVLIWQAAPASHKASVPPPRLTAASAAKPSLVTRPIEQVEVGMRVKGRNPQATDGRIRLADPDPTSWRKLVLRMRKATGKELQIDLLRPLGWIEHAGAKEGSTIELDLAELGAAGEAEVLAVLPCPAIETGAGSVVSGKFTHEPEDNLVNVLIEGQDEPIGCTHNHPFWSEGRRDFVPAGSLQPGEHVRTRTAGIVKVASVGRRPRESLVYNLEVHGQHVYEVGNLGLLVHNSCGTTTLYRAVLPEELADINKLGGFRIPAGGVEAKYFTTSEEAAASYAKLAGNAYKESYTVVSTTVPTEMLREITMVDRGIPAVLLSSDNLRGLVPNILGYVKVPNQ